MQEQGTTQTLEALQNEIKSVIERFLRERVTSFSSKDRKETGNAYQAVRLGEHTIAGFRSNERSVFAGIKLENKTVIDLGCNLGEICRDAARAGAKRVEGIEYDHFFVQLARYIAAYNKLDTVSYRQGDLTRADVYSGKYDVVSALSVFTYIKEHLDLIADMVGELLVIETHSVRADWKSEYLEPIQRNFEHVAVVGISDHKASNKAEARYLIFASRQPLDSLLVRRARALKGKSGVFKMDLTKSSLKYGDDFLTEIGLTRGASVQELLAATKKRWPYINQDDLAEDVRRRGVVQSPLYWAKFFEGYSDYVKSSCIDSDNAYYQTLRHLVDLKLYDPAFGKMMQESLGAAAERFEHRYRALEEIAHGVGHGNTIDPIILYNIPEKPTNIDANWKLYIEEAQSTTVPKMVDGHHRLFLSYVLGKSDLDAIPMWYPKIAAIVTSPVEQEDIWSGVYEVAQKLWQGKAGSNALG